MVSDIAMMILFLVGASIISMDYVKNIDLCRGLSFLLVVCTQKVEEFTTPVAGDYMIECWGAQGSNMLDKAGGKGGYCKGTVKLTHRTIYIYVGAQSGGFGGGGVTTDSERAAHFGNDGGGATDVRLVKGSTYKEFNSLMSRIIVAAGGGGANHRNSVGEDPQWGQGDGGYGGGLNGGDGLRDDNTMSWASANLKYICLCYGANQTSGGKHKRSYRKSSDKFDDNFIIDSDLGGKFGYAATAPASFVQLEEVVVIMLVVPEIMSGALVVLPS